MVLLRFSSTAVSLASGVPSPRKRTPPLRYTWASGLEEEFQRQLTDARRLPARKFVRPFKLNSAGWKNLLSKSTRLRSSTPPKRRACLPNTQLTSSLHVKLLRTKLAEGLSPKLNAPLTLICWMAFTG